MYSQKEIDSKMELLDILSNHATNELGQFRDRLHYCLGVLDFNTAKDIFDSEGCKEYFYEVLELTL